MDALENERPPNLRRQTIWMWVVFFALTVLIGCCCYLLLQTSTKRQATPDSTASQPPPASDHWGDRYCYAGVPQPTPAFHDHITILTNTGYLVGYCEARRDPVWVCYRLFRPDSLQVPPRPKAFESDLRTTARVNSRDYTGSGYDRGHMAPNYAVAVCYGTNAQRETFLMSNIVPQRPTLNRQVWMRLEQTEIRDYAGRYGQVWVIVGPVFRSHNHLKNDEDIPDACYKIICREEGGSLKMLAFIIPQTVKGTEFPQQFLTSIHEIETETGLNFFSTMPEDLQQRLESEKATGMW